LKVCSNIVKVKTTKVWPLFHVEKVGERNSEGKMVLFDDPIVFKLNKDLFYTIDNTEEVFDHEAEEMQFNVGVP
jgi:hypothetical protein